MNGVVYEGVLEVHMQEMRTRTFEVEFSLCGKVEKGPW
jgi:hypothetical protein